MWSDKEKTKVVISPKLQVEKIKQAYKKSRLKFGHSPFSGKKVIELHPIMKTPIRKEGYCEVIVELEDGSKMKVVCHKDDKINLKEAREMVEKHNIYWREVTSSRVSKKLKSYKKR